jgi:hypothetical protein
MTVLAQVAKSDACDGSPADLLLGIIRDYLQKPSDEDIISMWLETESGGGDDPDELIPDCVRIDLGMELLAEVPKNGNSALASIPRLSRIMTWKRSTATYCVVISKRWSSRRWSGARHMGLRFCNDWKTPGAVCFGSKKVRCIQPSTASKRQAKSRPAGKANLTAGVALGGASIV